MHVGISKLFETFLEAESLKPEASLVFSLATPERLGSFLNELDPALKLDWSELSFQGHPCLRQKVVATLGYSPECCADDVLITAGANEANFLAVMQLVQPGEEMIVDVPGWPQPQILGEAAGVVVKKLPRHEASAWRFDMNELASLITPKTRLIFICNPNNPTGRVTSTEELKQVIDLARPVGAYILCDEVYRGLEWHGSETPRIACLYEKGISTGSLSKIFGMQGLRIGWMICRDNSVIRLAMALREQTSEVMNVLGEHIAGIALTPQRFHAALAKVRQNEYPNVEKLARFISETSTLTWHSPQAALIGFCRLNLPVTGDVFARRLLDAPYKTLVMSGSAYGYPQHIRLGVGGGLEANIDLGLQRMQLFLNGEY